MADNLVTASIVVQFGDTTDANTHVSIEVDSRTELEGGLNKGKTTFSAGDTVYLLVYKSDNVTLVTQSSSSGLLTLVPGQVYISKEDEVSFIDSDESSANKPIHKDFQYTWIGDNHDLGHITPLGGYPNVRASSKTLYEVGIASLSYKSLVSIYRLETPAEINGDSNYNVLCVVYARAD